MTAAATFPPVDELGWGDLIPEHPGEYRTVVVARRGGRSWITDRIAVCFDADYLADRIAEPLPDMGENQVWVGSTCVESILRDVVFAPRLAEDIEAAWARHIPAAVDLADVLLWTDTAVEGGRIAVTADRRRGLVVPERLAALIVRLGLAPVLGDGRWGYLVADTEQPPRVAGLANLGEPRDTADDAILFAAAQALRLPN